MPKIAEVKLSSCGLEFADFRKNCDCGTVEEHFFKKLRNCDCGSASFKLRNCDCGLKQKLRVPTSGWEPIYLLENMPDPNPGSDPNPDSMTRPYQDPKKIHF
jgi:hypothetical protein